MPIVFYDQVVYEVAVSVEGYISTDALDPGTDNTPDVLPAEPSHGSAGAGRVYALYADLSIGTGTPEEPRGVFYQYFHHSPHVHHNGGGACVSVAKS